jgi:hypothetical protein
MSQQRLDAVKAELRSWENRRTGTKRELLSLIGKLVFISRIVRPGRIFMRRLIALSTTVHKLHYKVPLSKDAREDIDWWINTVDNWNCRSVFLEELWSTSVDFSIYTDACGYGIGAVFGRKWFCCLLPESSQLLDISWKELFAVVIACKTWGEYLTGKRLRLYCDNIAVVAVVNSGSSRSESLMSLVRELYHVAVTYNFDIRLEHVPGINNTAADLLSRLQLGQFHAMFANEYDLDPSPVRGVFD